MTNEDEMVIRELARRVCANQFASKGEQLFAEMVRAGKLDSQIEVILTEAAIREGIKLGRSM